MPVWKASNSRLVGGAATDDTNRFFHMSQLPSHMCGSHQPQTWLHLHTAMHVTSLVQLPNVPAAGQVLEQLGFLFGLSSTKIVSWYSQRSAMCHLSQASSDHTVKPVRGEILHRIIKWWVGVHTCLKKPLWYHLIESVTMSCIMWWW